MSVYSRVVTKSGMTGTVTTNGCWGFLKENVAALAQRIVDDISEEAWMKEREHQRRYGFGSASLTYSLFVEQKNRQTLDRFGVAPNYLVDGIDSIIIENAAICDRQGWQMYTTLVNSYPRMFEGVTADPVSDTITVSFDQHYAIVYNQLRILKRIEECNSRWVTARVRNILHDAVVNHPDLSLFILDVYAVNGRAAWNDSNLFMLEHLSLDVMKGWVKKRDYHITPEDRYNPTLFASNRGGCYKIVRDDTEWDEERDEDVRTGNDFVGLMMEIDDVEPICSDELHPDLDYNLDDFLARTQLGGEE